MSRLFAPLRKAAENDDGTLTVEGVASTESEDASGEVVTADAMRAALPDFMRFGKTGALREMHGMSAAGRVDKAEVGADGVTTISAVVVDANAIRKIRKGVYKGLSIGGRALKRDAKNRNVITKIALTEISLVDRPANPEAILTMWKADLSAPPFSKADIADALAELSPEERALALMKATHRLQLGREFKPGL